MTDFNYSESEIKLVEKAVDFATEKHDKQLRKSGEPYIIHPIAVAILLVELYLDTNSISAAILHDVLEDTECTEEEIKKQFNDDVAQLVVLVTKVSNISKINRGVEDYKSKDKNDYIIQVFMSISIDIRAIIIKIADRLHNMKTIEHLKPEKQKRIARETLEIYANIAGRLGLFSIKTELLNICFKVLHQKKYNQLTETVNAEIELKGEKFESTVENIEKILNNNSINYEIRKRIKGVYSTYLKNEFETNAINCTDLFGVRIIVDDIMDCYAVLGLIHLNYYHVKSNLKDYISNPKANLYQSIHTTIIFEDSTIEIQIRTKNMDIKNEFGIAGH
jgi:RelA/SpoT family (p)ppGpp synthetase